MARRASEVTLSHCLCSRWVLPVQHLLLTRGYILGLEFLFFYLITSIRFALVTRAAPSPPCTPLLAPPCELGPDVCLWGGESPTPAPVPSWGRVKPSTGRRADAGASGPRPLPWPPHLHGRDARLTASENQRVGGREGEPLGPQHARCGPQVRAPPLCVIPAHFFLPGGSCLALLIPPHGLAGCLCSSDPFNGSPLPAGDHPQPAWRGAWQQEEPY